MGYFMRNGPSLQAIKNGCTEALQESETNSKVYEIRNGEHPKVGCVILDSEGNQIVKTHTRQMGKLHAEAYAIEKLAEMHESGHTLITTLEPCSFRNLKKHGNDIPCAKRIVRAGIKQVVIGILDPGIGVKGRGAYILSRRRVYYTMFPHDIYLKILRSNASYIKKREAEITPSWQLKEFVPVEREFDLGWHPQIISSLTDRSFLERLETYHTEWINSSYDIFAEYLIGQKQSEIIDALGEYMKSLISDYLAVPPEDNANIYAINAIADWYQSWKEAKLPA